MASGLWRLSGRSRGPWRPCLSFCWLLIGCGSPGPYMRPVRPSRVAAGLRIAFGFPAALRGSWRLLRCAGSCWASCCSAWRLICQGVRCLAGGLVSFRLPDLAPGPVWLPAVTYPGNKKGARVGSLGCCSASVFRYAVRRRTSMIDLSERCRQRFRPRLSFAFTVPLLLGCSVMVIYSRIM